MKNIIDLTHCIEEEMTICPLPWHAPVSITQVGHHEIEGRATQKISMGSHTGTHTDAPLHFINGGACIEDLSLDVLIGEVSIFNFSHLKEYDAVTEKMLAGRRVSQRVIFNFGWFRRWKTDKFYTGYPYFSESAVQYLIKNKIKLIGMDTPSPDDSRTKIGGIDDSKMHKLFLSNNVVLVEYLANLDKIDEKYDWNIIVMPLKIKYGDGAPSRVCVYRND